MRFRMCYQVLGGHTHVRVFAGDLGCDIELVEEPHD